MRNIFITISTFLKVFFKFSFLNAIIISICLIIYGIFIPVKDAIRNRKLQILLLIIMLMSDLLLIYWWYTLFGIFAIIVPCILIFIIILAYLMYASDK